MKPSKASRFCFAAFAAIISAGCCTSHHVTKWEYRQVNNLGAVNQLAEQGWTVVNFAVPQGGGDTQYLLRRPKP